MNHQSAGDVLSAEEEQVLRDAVSLNTKIAAVSAAVVFGFLILLITMMIRLRLGPDVESAANIPALFMPGYRVSYGGAWIGMVWGFIYGAVSGAVMYATYARTLRGRITRQLALLQGADSLRAPTFVIAGPALGLSLGVTAAAALIIATLSVNLSGNHGAMQAIELLGQYLPGFRVGLVGSVLGAVEIFVLVFVAANILAWIYNKMARRRRAIDR